MKVSTEIDNNFGYEKITQLVDNIPLNQLLLRWLLGIGCFRLGFTLGEYTWWDIHVVGYTCGWERGTFFATGKKNKKLKISNLVC
jgi:hypothetical protein